MTEKRLLIHTIFLFLMPVIVAWFGLSLAAAVALVIVALLWRWAISLSVIIAPEKVPKLELETISASHFVEKVRWAMDRLGVEYREKQVAGTLGVFYRGRTVPQLKIRTGAVRSVIGNSPEILRYLWGAYGETLGEIADFLRPDEERRELEKTLDRYGVDLQVWVYYQILPDRELSLRAWGFNNPVLPAWQRWALFILFPVQRFLIRRGFKITDAHYAKAVEHVDKTLADIEQRLSDGRKSILGGDNIDYVDITFAALSALWLQPPQFGAGKLDAVRIEPERWPEGARADVQRWTETYPVATSFIERLYAEER